MKPPTTYSQETVYRLSGFSVIVSVALTASD
jgi:hypothetical protein